MSFDAYEMIDALIKSQLSPEFAHKEGGETRPIVVTISRDYGSGGREVAEGQVPVRPHGILTGRFAFEVLDHALILKGEAESQTGDKVLDEHK